MADSSLNFSSLDPLRQQAQSASSEAANLSSNVPGLLDQLRTNLTTIFAKDNPLIQERGNLLERFLNTPSSSRVATLPSSLPQVEGSNLNLSPTQQDAITAARYNAAFVPLAGLNNVITGIYGNIPQLVEKAGNIYDAQVRAAQIRAQLLQQQYQDSLNQLLEQEKVRQFNAQFAENQRQFDVSQRNKRSGAGNGPININYPTSAKQSANQAAGLNSLVEPDLPNPVYGPPVPTRTSSPKFLPDNLMSRNSLNLGTRGGSSAVLNNSVPNFNFSPIGNFFNSAGNFLGNAGNSLLKTLAYAGG